jgi:hypothetical protein
MEQCESENRKWKIENVIGDAQAVEQVSWMMAGVGVE